MPPDYTPEPFTFGIALLSRRSARNWPLIEALFGLTWASLTMQTDPDFRVIVAGHEPPSTLPADPRVSFLAVDWPSETPSACNGDGGRKKDLLSDLVLGSGGGLFMALDADDWVDVNLVRTARQCIIPNAVGGLIGAGFAVDFQHLRCAMLPLPELPAIEFHHVCGSSTVARLDPALSDPLRRNAFRLLGSHHKWTETATELRANLVRLRLAGAYVVNTSENHSELHGPHARWRREFVDCLHRHGTALDQGILSRFGLSFGLVAHSLQTLST